jgi:hypothetical protein
MGQEVVINGTFTVREGYKGTHVRWGMDNVKVTLP